jgi:hypothetical protein
VESVLILTFELHGDQLTVTTDEPVSRAYLFACLSSALVLAQIAGRERVSFRGERLADGTFELGDEVT